MTLDWMEDEPSRLALAYKAGDRSVLGALHEAIRPMLASALLRYRAPTAGLPASLDRADLAQQAWIILAELARRWDPAGGSFGAYFRVSFPWAISRYIKYNTPSRRSKRVWMLGAENPDVQARMDLRAGADGRDWDIELAWTELLAPLTERERTVLLLHLAQQQSFTEVAHAMQLTRPAAFRL